MSQHTQMTSRERILAALRGQEVDYVPCCACFNPLSEVQNRGHTWNFPWKSGAPPEKALDIQVRELGLDQVLVASVDLCKQAPGVDVSVVLDGDVLHKTYDTPVGKLHAAVRYNDMWPDGKDIHFHSDFNIGHCVEPWIQTEQDLECLKLVRQLSDATDVLAEAKVSVGRTLALAKKYDLATMAFVGSGMTGAMGLFGVNELCMLTIEDPDLLDAYLEHEHQINVRTIEVLGSLGVETIRRNGFYETTDLYSPDTLRRFLSRRLSKEADAAHAAGMLTSYTVHTGLMPIVDYLADLNFDSFFGVDIAFKNTDLRVLHSALTPAKTFWTGPSSTFHLWNGPDATREAVREVMGVFGNRNLILAPCVSAHSIMPWESTLAMVDEWKKLR